MNKMVVSPITHFNYASKRDNTVQGRKQVNFKGSIGDMFVLLIDSGKKVDAPKVLSQIKGGLGIKTNKAKDVIESFIARIQELKTKKESLIAKIKEEDSLALKLQEEKDKAVSKYELELKEKNKAIKDKEKKETELYFDYRRVSWELHQSRQELKYAKNAAGRAKERYYSNIDRYNIKR